MQHADMWMIQAGNGFRFAFKSLLANGITRKLFWQNLDRDSALQSRIPRAIHFAHPACAQR